MKRLKVFFITCAAVALVGLVMLVAGASTGGVEGFDAVAADHDWISGSPGARASVEQNDLEFENIEAIGYMDVVIVGERYYNDMADEYELGTITEPNAGTVIALFGSNLEEPDFKVEGKTLKINAPEIEQDKITLNFSSEDVYPTVIVFCPDKELKSIKLNSSISDVEMKGISFKYADIANNTGDVDAENITSQGIKIISDTGDVELSGDLRGTTDVSIETGDVEIDTALPLDKYTMNLKTDTGEIGIGEGEIEDDDFEGYEYTQDGGEDELIIRTNTGDIEIEQMAGGVSL